MTDVKNQNQSCPQPDNCPYIPDQRYINETLKRFDRQLKDFDVILDDLKKYKNRIIGAVIILPLLINIAWRLLFK